MSLLAKLTADVKEAMKARESKRRDALRLLISDLKVIVIKEFGGGDVDEKANNLDESVELSFLSTQAKRRRDSIESYEAAGRDDLAEQEKFELGVITSYLPEQLSREEAEGIVREAMEASGATSRKQMGLVMKEAMPKLKGRFPGGEIKGIVMSLLDG